MGRPRVHDAPRVATAVRLRGAARARDVSVDLLVTRVVSEHLHRLPPPGAGGEAG